MLCECEGCWIRKRKKLKIGGLGLGLFSHVVVSSVEMLCLFWVLSMYFKCKRQR